MSTPRQLIALLLCTTALAACVSSASNDTDESGGRDTAESDVAADDAPDGEGSGLDATSDAENGDEGSGDDATADTDPADTDPADTDPADVTDVREAPDDCADVGTECEPSSIRCSEDGTAVVFCNRCGFELDREVCGFARLCEATARAAECRDCVGEECPVVLACEPDGRACVDHDSFQVCDSEGNVDTESECPAGRRCFDGRCGPAGGDTGAACTANLDPTSGCAGTLCVCGTEFIAAAGASWCEHPRLSGGYCSTANCATNGCRVADEVCADFRASGLYGGGSFCVAEERCTTRGRACGTSGFTCEELPARRIGGPLAWDMACWVDGPSTIGESCTADSDCLGGVCRTRDIGGAQVSYCTARCGADAGCPSFAACVEDPDASSGYVCLAKASGDSCPRLTSEPFNITALPPLPRFGRGSDSVCYFAR